MDTKPSGMHTGLQVSGTWHCDTGWQTEFHQPLGKLQPPVSPLQDPQQKEHGHVTTYVSPCKLSRLDNQILSLGSTSGMCGTKKQSELKAHSRGQNPDQLAGVMTGQ